VFEKALSVIVDWKNPPFGGFLEGSIMAFVFQQLCERQNKKVNALLSNLMFLKLRFAVLLDISNDQSDFFLLKSRNGVALNC